MAGRDFYAVLGVGREASPDEIKRAYRKAALEYHPDRNPGDADAEERFKEAAEAYSVLGDPERRARYDRFGEAGIRSGGGPAFQEEMFADFADILGDFFGFGSFFGGRAGGRRSGRGASIRATLEIDLEEAVRGAGRELRFRRQEPCPDCDARGSRDGGGTTTCPQCGGVGQVQQRHGFLTIARPCGRCGGAGQFISDPCSTCRGEGRVQRVAEVAVKVPPGVDTGNRLRLRGEGEAGLRGAPPGDLEVVLRVKEHARFARSGRDLYTQIPVSFPLAALGGTVRVASVDGEDADLEVPSGTQPGDVFELAGLGMPDLDGGRRGALKVAIQVETPRKVTPEQRVLIEQLAEITDEPVPRDVEDDSWWSRLRKWVS